MTSKTAENGPRSDRTTSSAPSGSAERDAHGRWLAGHSGNATGEGGGRPSWDSFVDAVRLELPATGGAGWVSEAQLVVRKMVELAKDGNVKAAEFLRRVSADSSPVVEARFKPGRNPKSWRNQNPEMVARGRSAESLLDALHAVEAGLDAQPLAHERADRVEREAAAAESERKQSEALALTEIMRAKYAEYGWTLDDETWTALGPEARMSWFSDCDSEAEEQESEDQAEAEREARKAASAELAGDRDSPPDAA